MSASDVDYVAGDHCHTDVARVGRKHEGGVDVVDGVLGSLRKRDGDDVGLFAGFECADLGVEAEGSCPAEGCGVEHVSCSEKTSAFGAIARRQGGVTRFFEKIADVVAGN